uniref:Clathrin light chain n=2 Tax=Lygus hesperus TaxID=30085 RepID=A0A0K8SK48_LYGHE
MEDIRKEDIDDLEVDPAAEFLAREQNDLAGLEDELKPATIPPVNGSEPEMSDNTGSFEMINTIGDPDVNDQTNIGGPSDNPSPAPKIPRDEPEKIKKWREEQKRMLEEKDKNEEVKKQEWRETAKKELEEWYKHHEELVAKTRASNREAAKNAEKQFVADSGAIEPGTEWERIAKLCDFNPKTNRTSKDVSRMRSIILQLKQTPISSKHA